MKKRTMLVAGLGAAGALFLSVNAGQLLQPLRAPLRRIVTCSLLMKMTTEYVIIRKTGRMFSSPIA